MTAILSAEDAHIRKYNFPAGQKLVALTLDLEADYGGNSFEVTHKVVDLLERLKPLNMPLTIFCEGRIFAQFPDLIASIKKYNTQIELHCLNHTKQGGDDRTDLQQSIAHYYDTMGQRPTGYRAHTFRLTKEILDSLAEQGFLWDSSILPAAFGYGANRDKIWKHDGRGFFDIQPIGEQKKRLLSFPVSVYRRFAVPLNFSYRSLMRHSSARLLDYFLGLPEILIFDMHMVDLFYSTHFKKNGAIPKSAQYLYGLNWLGRQDNLLDELMFFINRLQLKNYKFVSMADLYNEAIKIQKQQQGSNDT